MVVKITKPFSNTEIIKYLYSFVLRWFFGMWFGFRTTKHPSRVVSGRLSVTYCPRLRVDRFGSLARDRSSLRQHEDRRATDLRTTNQRESCTLQGNGDLLSCPSAWCMHLVNGRSISFSTIHRRKYCNPNIRTVVVLFTGESTINQTSVLGPAVPPYCRPQYQPQYQPQPACCLLLPG